MHIVIIIIVVLVVGGIIISLLEWLWGLVLGFFGWLGALFSELYKWLAKVFVFPILVIAFVLAIIAYFVYSWQVSVYTLVGGFIVGFLFKAIARGAAKVSDRIEQHDIHKKETALVEQQTEEGKKSHANEMALIEELNKNCRWLGYMNDEKWRNKLPNYANKKYSSSFTQITKNFAIQSEQQTITQNDDWFKPFIDYLVNHPQGSTPTKMLSEVNCVQFSITHYTPDLVILTKRLEQGTKKVSRDVPPILNAVPVDGMNEPLYVPTPYFQKIYGQNQEVTVSHGQELNFDDL